MTRGQTRSAALLGLWVAACGCRAEAPPPTPWRKPQTRPAVVAATGPAGGVQAPTKQDRHDAVTPMPRRDDGYRRLHASFVARAQQGGIDVLFLGDSIIHGWTGAGKRVWQREYAPLKAACFGIPADMTQFLLWRLDNGELEGIRPKVVVVMIGTNNLKSGPTRMAPEDATAGVAEVVKLVREKLPDSRVLLLGILHRQPKYPWMAETVRQANRLLAKLADGKQVRFCDFSDRFCLPDGTINPELMSRDLLHLSGKGYEAWADAMGPALKEMLAASP